MNKNDINSLKTIPISEDIGLCNNQYSYYTQLNDKDIKGTKSNIIIENEKKKEEKIKLNISLKQKRLRKKAFKSQLK